MKNLKEDLSWLWLGFLGFFFNSLSRLIQTPKKIVPVLKKIVKTISFLLAVLCLYFVLVAFITWNGVIASEGEATAAWFMIYSGVYLLISYAIGTYKKLFITSTLATINLMAGVSLFILIVSNYIWDIYTPVYASVFGLQSLIIAVALIYFGLKDKLISLKIRLTRPENVVWDKFIDNILGHLLPKAGLILLESGIILTIILDALKPELKSTALGYAADSLMLIGVIVWTMDFLLGTQLLIQGVANQAIEDVEKKGNATGDKKVDEDKKIPEFFSPSSSSYFPFNNNWNSGMGLF